VGPSCPTRDGLTPCHLGSAVLASVATLLCDSTFFLVLNHTLHICFGAALQFCLHFLQEFLPHSFGFCGVLDCSHSYRFSVGILDEWIQTVSMPLLFPWV
jgi:hypothetical protein